MERQLNSIKKITMGPWLSDCPIWWQNYMSEIYRNGNKFTTRMLFKNWKIEIAESNNNIELIFPSEEVYTQFVLTHSD